LLKSDKRSGYFTLRRLYINIILEWEMLQSEVEKILKTITTHI
jgi:hypothetical protein